MTPGSFVVLGGGELPWIYPLAVELARVGPTAVIRFGVAVLPPRRPATWPFEDAPPELRRLAWTYPPGFNGRLSPLFRRGIRRRLARTSAELVAAAGADPLVIVCEPAYERYVEGLPPRRLVYLNYDDYAIYDEESGAITENPAEARLMEQAGTIVCASLYQRDRLRERFPQRADAIFHLPHGVHETFLNPAPEQRPSSTDVCIVGSLTARYDWRLIADVVSRMPRVVFTFAGELVGGQLGRAAEGWQEQLRWVLDQPNVRHATGLRHRETAPIYWRSGASWLPYDVSTRFVRASSPLKVSDSLASGRAVVSADVPECRLYPEWIRVHHDADEAVALLSAALVASIDSEAPARSDAQVRFARANTWRARADRLVELAGRS